MPKIAPFQFLEQPPSVTVIALITYLNNGLCGTEAGVGGFGSGGGRPAKCMRGDQWPGARK